MEFEKELLEKDFSIKNTSILLYYDGQYYERTEVPSNNYKIHYTRRHYTQRDVTPKGQLLLEKLYRDSLGIEKEIKPEDFKDREAINRYINKTNNLKKLKLIGNEKNINEIKSNPKYKDKPDDQI